MKEAQKNIILAVSLNCLVAVGALCQSTDAIGIDCNPRLNQKEINALKASLSNESFDFNNKTIGFASLNILRVFGLFNFAGFHHSLLPITKKEYFSNLSYPPKQKPVSILLPFNAEQKKESGGFDAVVVLIPKKLQKKISERTTRVLSEVFGYRDLNYPDNINLVGNDAKEDLTNEDAVFFNTIYEHRRADFDFKNKRIAFVNPHEKWEFKKKTKKEYIHKVKKHLESDFLYPGDHLDIFTEAERKETGYDAVVVYSSKVYYKRDIMELLKKQGD